MQKILNYIGGEFVEAASGKFIDNFDPSRGEVYSLIPDSDQQDVEKAVSAAEAAFPFWRDMPVAERTAILNKIADLVKRDLDKLAQAESRDNGKPVSLAKALDIPRCESNIRFFAAAALHTHSEAYMTDTTALNYTQHTPLGVVGVISPWNLPLYIFTWKVLPALAAGNCVVAKPSEITPMTAFLFSQLAHEAGLPPGVLNLVHGLGAKAGEALVLHKKVKAVSFTGSTLTGRRIANGVAGQFKKVSLEMGGKNANIIFADADLEKALDTSVRSSFLNQGQICLCGSRIFVERSVYEKFSEQLVERTKKLKIGDPLNKNTQHGALVSKPHLEKVLSYIETAKSEGGKILCGGKAPVLDAEFKNGYFLEPTLIEGLAYTAKTNQEEIFGPVATLIPFDTEEEVIKMANSTNYGLSASVWTNDLKRAHRVAGKIDSGVVWVNTWMLRDLRTPFGGMKESGVGREGGIESLKFFSETKNICIALK